MEIPSEAVEAVAKELLRIVRPAHPNWDEWTEDGQDMYRSQAIELLEAAAPHMLKDMRRMTEVELARRDRPEAMELARQRLQQERREGRTEMVRAAKEAAWDEGQRAWEDELLGKASGTNPYRRQI